MPEKLKRTTFYSQDEVERLLRRHRPGAAGLIALAAVIASVLGFFAGWLVRGVWK